MKIFFKIIVLLSLVLACTSSKIFKQYFSSVKSGMSRTQVRTIMGEPKHFRVAVLPHPPFFGPPESLVQFLNPGTSYEEWEYSDEKTIYLIWFSSKEEVPQESWTVVTKFSYPKDAVF